jgi:hypothetical protein
VSDVLREVDGEALEEVKMQPVGDFFRQKFLRLYRLPDKYCPIAVDATGVMSFDRPLCERCLVRETKNTTKWYHCVLEAYVTNLSLNAGNLPAAATGGRLRWNPTCRLSAKHYSLKRKQ